ncbi:SMI1/KNR4 family protein [Ruminococcus sp.]|uniref:SMI1/KNR4 family protein n=1 Tax=Ruminococcus sp. TaxID=41978 RepID=UPI0025F7B012|nr:SMI1/KNR4 family protein [Ruminococcus sp.]MBQ8967576.1 SMI1/KNR4 family protein [Ruminococcus sp.]
MLDRFIKWAEANGWNIVTDSEKIELPEEIRKRYAVPDKWYSFICRLRICENSSQDKWFLTPLDFADGGNDESFRWNEFELMSLEWTDNDSSVRKFWDRHMPIVMSVAGGYSYYAIDTENGRIVTGCEPEFEEARGVAESFEEFIEKIIAGEIVL